MHERRKFYENYVLWYFEVGGLIQFAINQHLVEGFWDLSETIYVRKIVL